MVVAYCDFETTNLYNNENEIVDAKICLWGMIIGGEFYWGINISEWFGLIMRLKPSKVYFHNASYDVAFLRSYLVNEWHFKPCGIIGNDCFDGCPKKMPKTFKEMSSETGIIYKFQIFLKDGFPVNIECTYLKTMLSISSWGDILNMPKGEIDYQELKLYKFKKEVPEKFVEYLKRDIEIMVLAHQFVMNTYGDKLTRASLSIEDFKKFYGSYDFSRDFGGFRYDYKLKKKKWVNVLTKEQWEFVKNSYSGGYVNWKKGIETKDIYCEKGIALDVNSLYPYSMSNFEMPYGSPQKYNSPGCVALHYIKIEYATLKDDLYPPIIKDNINSSYMTIKYLSVVDNPTYRTYWQEELDLIEKLYRIKYKIKETYYFKTKKVFDKWINSRFHMKQNASTNAEAQIHKGVLNSLYGKFAQHYKREAKILMPLEPDDKVRINQVVYGTRNKYIFKRILVEDDYYTYIPIASYITMKSRMVLFNAIIDNKEHWLYSDTDSCYFSSTNLKNIQVHHNKIGYWKGERLFNRFKVLRAKCYFVGQTHIPSKESYFNGDETLENINWIESVKVVKKISGLNEKAKEVLDWDNFKIGTKLEGVKLAKRHSFSGVVLEKTDFEFKAFY